MSRLAMVRGVAALLLALAYALLAQASERLSRRPAAAPVRVARAPVPRHEVELSGFAREMEAAVARLQKEAGAPPPAAPAAASVEEALARLFREETRAAVRAGVLATCPERLERLTRELGLEADEAWRACSALARVTETLADRWADALAEGPAAVAPLDSWARQALRVELARFLTPERMARFDAGSVFREDEWGR